MASYEVNFDELMQGIREDMPRKREQDGMNVSKVNPIGEIWRAVHSNAIEEASARIRPRMTAAVASRSSACCKKRPRI